MRKFKGIALSVILITLLATACSETVTPIPYTYTHFFTGDHSRTWKVQFVEFTTDGKTEDTFTNECFTDDLYIFRSGVERLYEVQFGSVACSGDPDGNIEDSWGFNNATATLTMVVPFLADQALPFIVRQASDSKFETEIFLDQEGTQSYRIHFTKSKEN